MNNIPKEKNVYGNTMNDYATIDNELAKSQTDIGESSNLAQIAQTYDCTFNEQKYSDYVCILSVIAQAAIDNAKRRFDIDISSEIKRIKKDMNISENKYPDFWRIIKHGFNKKYINSDLHCPMNYLVNIEVPEFRKISPTIPMSELFIKHKLELNRRVCKKVEELIVKYSLDLYNAVTSENQNIEDWILLRSDFSDLIRDIKGLNISSNYIGLMSWLLDRAFIITNDVIRNRKLQTNLDKNKSLLVKVLYEINPSVFLKCFKK